MSLMKPSSLKRRRFFGLLGGGMLTARVSPAESESLMMAVGPEKWGQIETAVDFSLQALASRALTGVLGDQQHQPATSALCVMAFLSRGHLPGAGQYGELLTNSIRSVINSQAPNGLFGEGVGHNAEYHHAIAGLMLCEAYGLTDGVLSRRIFEAITCALRVTRVAQTWTKSSPADAGGWRYFTKKTDSDLSVTGWHFMFYRSAKNAEFDVPEAWVIEALRYVHACAETNGGFKYTANGAKATFSMTAAGLLCMTMAGKNDHPMAHAAAEYLLTHDFNAEWRHYGLYYASQAMAQMGGRYWREFYPKMAAAQLKAQSLSGIWSEDRTSDDIATAWAVLSLTPPCQVLPIFQR